MKLLLLLSSTALLSWDFMAIAVAQPLQRNFAQPSETITVNQFKLQRPSTRAKLLLADQMPPSTFKQQSQQPINQPAPEEDDEDEDEIVVEGQKQPVGSAPIYVITGDEIQKQGSSNVTEILKNLPGFAINDAGFGADIHTGLYYRGTTLNQNTFLINGRSLGSNISTYHGATDLNTLLTGDIERVELSSGTASTLYGSEAFGGVVNIITKDGGGPTRVNALVQAGSYGQQNYRAGITGSINALSYAIGYERYQADNDYPVPRGAANRGDDGRLFNGDTTFDNYYGRLSFKINPRNTLSLDAYKVTSQKGLIYFGFPLQRDRLDHDALNLGLSWKALVGGGNDSILTASVGYNKDYFNTYGPTRNIFYRRGTLDSRGLTARVEHNWQVAPIYNLRYGIDLKGEFFEGEAVSNVPQLIRFNEVEERDRLNTALFILNTFKILDNFQLELGLRQNFNSEYGSSAHPSVGVRWELIPAIAIRGSWVSVRRNPGLDQLYVFDTVHNWLPNPNLKPEIGSAWTAGVDITLARSVTAQFTYFGNSLEDRLSVVAGQWSNIGLVNTNGYEAAVRWQITPQFSALVNYTYTDARIETGAEKGLQLSTIPFSVAQIGIGYQNAGWQVNLYANYHSGSRRALFTDTGASTTDFSPSWLNLDLNARIPLFKNIGLLLYLENLADVSYEKVNRIYQPGLTFRLGLSAEF
ncbi:MAG: TonB-dependent receptor [Leptolyngbyaceae cyanobacterium RU_5_1]|nr:TonB-dependent receptor [Leptolyngbyaceae cyanobacterium RU_5_1]